MFVSVFSTFLLMSIVISIVWGFTRLLMQVPASPYAKHWRDSTTRRFEPLIVGMVSLCYLFIAILAGLVTGIIGLSVSESVNPFISGIGVTVILTGLYLRHVSKLDSDMSPDRPRLSAGRRFGGAVFFILGACLIFGSLFLFLVGNLTDTPLISWTGFLFLVAGIGLALAAQLRFWKIADNADDTFVSPRQLPRETPDRR